MKGGHVNSGPPRNPNAVRRPQGGGDWRHLPAAGRTDPPPTWPLTRATAREFAIWNRNWLRPQAVAWADLGLEEEVALYVRSLARAEHAKAIAADRTLVRQLMESLGLTVVGMGRNRWLIDEVAAPATYAEVSLPEESLVPIRERFRLVGNE